VTATVLAGLLVAGAVGAPARYLLDSVVQEHTEGAFPWGTLVVNMTGSLVMGLMTGAALYHVFPEAPKIWLGTGFCGAYTTFSTFTFETIGLLEDGAISGAFANAAASLLACTIAGAAGLALAAAL
jgi:CrcB protein